MSSVLKTLAPYCLYMWFGFVQPGWWKSHAWPFSLLSQEPADVGIIIYFYSRIHFPVICRMRSILSWIYVITDGTQIPQRMTKHGVTHADWWDQYFLACIRSQRPSILRRAGYRLLLNGPCLSFVACIAPFCKATTHPHPTTLRARECTRRILVGGWDRLK